MYISYAGYPLERLGAAGQKFMAAFAKYLKVPKSKLPPYSVYQAQSAQIMLDAISRSDGTRASVTKEMFKARVTNGIMGTFHFDKKGDILPFKAISFDQIRSKAFVPVYAVILKA